jgi:hypothetical protein
MGANKLAHHGGQDGSEAGRPLALRRPRGRWHRDGVLQSDMESGAAETMDRLAELLGDMRNA